MSDLLSKVQELCKKKDISITKLEQELNFGKSTIAKWNNASPTGDKLNKVAKYFHVTLDYLIGNTDNVTCDECGFIYSPLSDFQVREHKHQHALWSSTVKRHGFCWTYAMSQQIIKESIEKFTSPNSTFDDKYEAVINYLKAHFSESLHKNNFSKNHADLKKFISMKLLDKGFINSISKDIYDKLIDEYGIYNSNDNNEIFFVNEEPVTYAAHKANDNIDWTDEELQDIEDFKKYVLSKRDKKDN